MDNANHCYCVILAGGKGRRLWPCSRVQKPKQFIDFFGTGRTQLQQTFDRVARLLPPGNIFVSTNVDYESLVKEQLAGMPEENILAEPIYRNTAPSVAWACHRINRLDPQACLLITPSDQTVQNDEAFEENITKGFEFARTTDCLLSLVVKPTRPEPGYGYIQLGEPMGSDVYKVQSFTEKPERDFAKVFMESGEFFWNTGVFISTIQSLNQKLGNLLPPVLRSLDLVSPDWTIAQEKDFVNEHFPSYPNLSFDYGVLEKSDNVYAMKCNFGWADLGTWHSIYEAMQKSDDDNVVIDSDVMIDEAHNNVIKLPKGKLGVINGLDGYIVAEQGNVLLICKKEDSSALVRKYVNEVLLRKGDDYI